MTPPPSLSAATALRNAGPPDVAADARRVLDRCRALVRPGLVAAVERMHPWLGEMAAYSLGWHEPGGPPPREGAPTATGASGNSNSSGGGKGVRQALAVLGAEAAGASGEHAVPGAVAVELVHTFSLLHDDIMDGDETRRQRPTVWKAYGTGPAVLAGDGIFALAVEVLAETPGARVGTAVRRLATAQSHLMAGQADDLLFERRPWGGPDAVRPGEYRTMAEAKTGALLGCAVALGALLAGAPEATVDTLDRAGRHLGVAFQAADDLLGIWGDPRVTGKPVHSDLRQGKKTHPVLAALSTDGSAARRLGELLASPRPMDAEAARTAAWLVEEAGGRTATLREAHAHLTEARACLNAVPLAPSAVHDLHTLLPFLVHRAM
ncbi:polyprenyl synthetase family protein [Streptomyces sp. NPDC054796]